LHLQFPTREMGSEVVRTRAIGLVGAMIPSKLCCSPAAEGSLRARST
jgi:hypothetical protein